MEKINYELEWTQDEEDTISDQILSLREDQIAALLNLSGLEFSLDDIEEVVRDIVDNKKGSGHLEILIYEAQSKEVLLWWINYFAKFK